MEPQRTHILYIALLLFTFSAVPIKGSEEKPYPCSSCKRKFKAKALADRCSFANENPEQIKSYIQANDQTQKVRTWRCPLSIEQTGCEKQVFLTLTAIRFHLQSHAKFQTCPFPSCGKEMKHKGSLDKHMLNHTLFRPFRCGYPGCKGYASTQEINVFTHVVTHLLNERKQKKGAQLHRKKQKKKDRPTPPLIEQLKVQPPNTPTLPPTQTDLPFMALSSKSDPFLPTLKELSLPPMLPQPDLLFSLFDENLFPDPLSFDVESLSA